MHMNKVQMKADSFVILYSEWAFVICIENMIYLLNTKKIKEKFCNVTFSLKFLKDSETKDDIKALFLYNRADTSPQRMVRIID